MFRFDYDAGRSVFEHPAYKLRVSKLFRPHVPNHHIGNSEPLWWCWCLEDELMVVGGGYTAFGGSAEGGEGIAGERHGPAKSTAGGNGAGQRHNAPRHTGVQAQLLAFHHIEGAVKRYDNLALVVESITGRAFAVCITIRRGGRFLFRSMSTATATAGTGFGPIASARFSRVGTNIVRHGNSNRLGE